MVSVALLSIISMPHPQLQSPPPRLLLIISLLLPLLLPLVLLLQQKLQQQQQLLLLLLQLLLPLVDTAMFLYTCLEMANRKIEEGVVLKALPLVSLPDISDLASNNLLFAIDTDAPIVKKIKEKESIIFSLN